MDAPGSPSRDAKRPVFHRRRCPVSKASASRLRWLRLFCGERPYRFDVRGSRRLGRHVAPIRVAFVCIARRRISRVLRRFRTGLRFTTPMLQHGIGDAFDMRHGNTRCAFERGQGPRRTQHHDIRAQAIDMRFDAKIAHARMNGIVEIECGERRARRVNALDQEACSPAYRARNVSASISNSRRAFTMRCRTPASK